MMIDESAEILPTAKLEEDSEMQEESSTGFYYEGM